MKTLFTILLLVPIALAAPRFKNKTDPVVSASVPHAYGYSWEVGITTDPYLSGNLVFLQWDYAADEGAFIPLPGYQIYRSVNGGPFVRVAHGIDQREYVDDMTGIPDESTVTYSIVTQAPGFPMHWSPILTFEYLEDWL